MDDTTIIIKQNRCFKEAIKELADYEDAFGEKVNYKKEKVSGPELGREGEPHL